MANTDTDSKTGSNTVSCTSFDGNTRIASGSLQANLLAVKHAVEAGAAGPVLSFDDASGRVIDFDLRGSDAEALARLASASTTAIEAPTGHDTAAPVENDAAGESRGRGRPKLGVVAREVTLLPRHWDWLAAQPGGASVTLRKLVEAARRANGDRERQRAAQERAYRFMSAMAGNMAGFEEASRALFAGDAATFHALTEAWPVDVRDHLRHLAFSDEV